MLTYKGYTATVEFDADANILHGEVMDTRDVITFQAESTDGVLKEFHASVDDYLEFCAERGEEPEKPFSGNFPVRTTSDIHKRVFLAANSAGLSVNAFVTSLLDKETMEFD